MKKKEMRKRIAKLEQKVRELEAVVECYQELSRAVRSPVHLPPFYPITPELQNTVTIPWHAWGTIC